MMDFFWLSAVFHIHRPLFLPITMRDVARMVLFFNGFRSSQEQKCDCVRAYHGFNMLEAFAFYSILSEKKINLIRINAK